MIISVVKIGNSRGIRIPKAILDQCNVKSAVELEVQDGKIVLDPHGSVPRKGWDEQFEKMAKHKDDELIIDDTLDVDLDEWEW